MPNKPYSRSRASCRSFRRHLLGGATLLGSAMGGSLAQADTITGPYVSLGGGYNIEQNQPAQFVPFTINPGPSHRDYRWSDGFVGEGSVGYGFGNGLRVELEGDDYGNSINNRVFSAIPNRTTGNDNMYGVMVNALYDFDLTRFGLRLPIPITPYLGVGVGYQWDHLSPLTTVSIEPIPNPAISRVGGTEGNFAYQGIVGLAYDIAPVPGLAATLEYRFLGTDAQDNRYTVLDYVGHIGRTGPVFLGDSFNHSFMVGLRYAFNAASPPPRAAPIAPVAPAPAPSRTYLVFFDWDRAALSPRAAQIVAEAVANSTRVQTTEIEVNGYADTSHALPGERGQAYNQRLSLRRADAVRTALIEDGVPAGVISVHGYGDTHLLVPTGPNVREPQNRRVEIILH